MAKILYDEDGEEGVVLPTKPALCPTCDGHGKHSRHLGAFTQSDREEWDPDEWDDYMTGSYDRTCETCNGKRVVEEVDEEQLTPAQRKAWRKQCREDAEYEAICAAERRMGA